MGDIEVVDVELPDGALLLVRAERVGDAGRGPSDVGLREFLTFSHVTASVRGIAAELHKALEAARPDLVAVEIGFDLAIRGSQVLALVADAGTQASIQVRLEWHRDLAGTFTDDPAEQPAKDPTVPSAANAAAGGS
jgi:hypothetical protein